MDEQNLQPAIERLQQVLLRLNSGGFETDVEPSTNAQAEVIAHFQPILSVDNLEQLTETDFRSFLLFRNNRHWTGLERQGSRIRQDMPALRRALATLQDENRPIAERYDYVMEQVKGMGRAITTAILLVLYPERYGVWNRKSEQGLKLVNLWPQQVWGESEGVRYDPINRILLLLCQRWGVDLWTLDALWHYLLVEEEER